MSTRDENWYSSNLRLVCLIEGEGGVIYQDSVLLLRADSFEEAFTIAIRLGRRMESEYLNGENKRVRWRLKELISLDIISGESLDGVEIYSEPNDLEPGLELAFEAEFQPEKSEPTQSI